MKNTVVTYIFGNNELLRDPTYLTPNTQYVVITDNPTIRSNIWTTVFVPRISQLDIRAQVAVAKFNPFIIPSEKYLIIDSSHKITSDLTPLFHMISCKTLCVKLHPKRVDIQTEVSRWKQYRGLSDLHEMKINTLLSMYPTSKTAPIYEGCFIGVSSSTPHKCLFKSVLKLLNTCRDNNTWFPSNQGWPSQTPRPSSLSSPRRN